MVTHFSNKENQGWLHQVSLQLKLLLKHPAMSPVTLHYNPSFSHGPCTYTLLSFSTELPYFFEFKTHFLNHFLLLKNILRLKFEYSVAMRVLKSPTKDATARVHKQQRDTLPRRTKTLLPDVTP